MYNSQNFFALLLEQASTIVCAINKVQKRHFKIKLLLQKMDHQLNFSDREPQIVVLKGV